MNIETENLQEFKDLLERYKTITLEEIREAFARKKNISHAKAALTGFGEVSTCTLCDNIDTLCHYCAWGPDVRACYRGLQKETYKLIEEAHTPEELLAAYRARAEHMEKHLNS